MQDQTMNKHYQRYYQGFKHPFVRDLTFALICPTVLTHWEQDNHHHSSINIHPTHFWERQFLAYKQRLQHIDTGPDYQMLTRFLMNKPSPHRLGFHFEGLILFWLLDGFKHGCHTFEVLAHNVQIFEGQKTLGEVDVIIKNHQTNEIEHWELAIKFYLGSPPFDPKDWIGINSKDNLQRKLNHMSDKPFRHDSICVDDQDYVIDKRYAVIKGRFFRPFNQTFVKPNWLNTNFPLHTWYDISNDNTLEQLHKLLHTEYLHLRKARYIEWFTERDFYQTLEKRANMVETLENCTTGLYFLCNDKHKTNQRPMVLTSRH